MKNTTPAILLLLACTAILASCGSDTAGTAPQDSGQTINLDEIEGLAVPRDEGTG
jgi:predicted small secreted protein